MEVNDIDLARLAAGLLRELGWQEPEGYLQGKTALRDAVVHRLCCSALEAEELVDTMEARGFLRFDGNPDTREDTDNRWKIEPEG